MGPSELGVSVSASWPALCRHCALWWKPAVVALAMREEGIRSALVALNDDTRRVLEESTADERLRATIAGHLRSAPNMMGVWIAESRNVNLDAVEQVVKALYRLKSARRSAWCVRRDQMKEWQ
jgi:hypothetical protein